jgi:hypothetical protein
MRLESLRAGAVEFNDHLVFALDVPPDRRVEGLLGMDILGGFQAASAFHKPLLRPTPSLTPKVVSLGIPKR